MVADPLATAPSQDTRVKKKKGGRPREAIHTTRYPKQYRLLCKPWDSYINLEIAFNQMKNGKGQNGRDNKGDETRGSLFKIVRNYIIHVQLLFENCRKANCAQCKGYAVEKGH